MSPMYAVRCRPAICERSYRHVLRAIREIASVLLVLGMSLVITGCAALGARLSGVSGPIAWHATDLRVVERDVAGAKRDLYAFTLVLEEIQGTAVTLTHAAYTISQPGVNAAGVSEQKALLWKLQPRGELRHPFSFYWYCSELQCRDWGPTAPWWNIILTGTDDRGQPVRVTIDIRLPQNPPGPQIGQLQEPPRTPQPTTASAATVEGRAVPMQVVNNTILVGAVLNHKEYVTLLLDTGATHTVLTPDTAKRLRISPPPDAPKHTLVVTGGQKVEVSFTQLSALALGEAVVENLQVGVALVLPEAPLVDGILGEDFLQRFTMTLHYATSRLGLESRETSRTPQLPTASTPAAGRHTVPLQIANNRIWVRAVLNHTESVTLLLDTGSAYTKLHPNTAQRLGVSPTANAPIVTTTVFGGRRITYPLVQLSTMAVGDAMVENLQVGVFLALPWAPLADGILGGDFLQHFTMTLDHASRRLQLASGAAVRR